MRILLAEDSTLLREALTALLDRLGHTVIAHAASAPELLAGYTALTSAPDLVITDVRMPPDGTDDGLRAALALRAENPTLPILVLSQIVAATYADDLLTLPAGAVGYLLKDRIGHVRDFARALATVASGGTVIDPEVVRTLLARGAAGPLDDLTPREREVLALMADGLSNTEIATRLFLSDAGISKHIGNVFSKLGLSPVDDNRRVRAVLTYLRER